jgi:hypothetical protein
MDTATKATAMIKDSNKPKATGKCRATDNKVTVKSRPPTIMPQLIAAIEELLHRGPPVSLSELQCIRMNLVLMDSFLLAVLQLSQKTMVMHRPFVNHPAPKPILATLSHLVSLQRL